MITIPVITYADTNEVVSFNANPPRMPEKRKPAPIKMRVIKTKSNVVVLWGILFISVFILLVSSFMIMIVYQI